MFITSSRPINPSRHVDFRFSTWSKWEWETTFHSLQVYSGLHKAVSHKNHETPPRHSRKWHTKVNIDSVGITSPGLGSVYPLFRLLSGYVLSGNVRRLSCNEFILILFTPLRERDIEKCPPESRDGTNQLYYSSRGETRPLCVGLGEGERETDPSFVCAGESNELMRDVIRREKVFAEVYMYRNFCEGSNL